MNLDDFKNLSLKDIGNWPWPAKGAALAALFVLLLAAGWWFDWSSQWDELENTKREEQTLRDTFQTKKRQAINLDIYRQQLKDIERSFGALLRQLPNKSEMDALLTDVNQAGLGRGLQFELFKPATQEIIHEFYAELPIDLKVAGNYHDLGAFASDVSKLPRIVTLDNVNIAADKDGRLSMNAVAHTYRYLDEEEAAAQKKKAAADKGTKK